MPFRIIQVVRECSMIGGSEAVCYELQRAWEDAGVPATVLAAHCDDDIHGGVRLVARWTGRMGVRGRWRYLGRLVAVPAFTVGATAALRRHRGAVVLSHGDTLAGDALVIHAVNKVNLLEKRRAGNYRWLLNPIHLWVAARDRWMIGGLRFRRYVAVSRRVAQEIAEHYGVPESRIALIPNGINLDRFTIQPRDREKAQREFGIPGDAPLLLFVGHEFDRKGLAHVIRAMPHLPANVHLLVVGSDPPQPYQRMADAEGVGPRVVFAGVRRDMPAIYAAADAFVLPTGYESFSLVCMEAMACGVPVFATRAGGIEDYLEDGVNGYAVTRDPENIAAMLRKALDDPGHLAQLREGAHATAQRYAWPSIAARYRELMHEIWLEREGSRGPHPLQ